MATTAPVRNPTIHGTKTDRTGAGGILRRAGAEIRKRYAALTRAILERFDRVPVYALNDIRTGPVRYGLTADQLAGIAEELQAAVQRWLLDGRDPQYAFWWDRYVEEANHLGTMQAQANLAGLSPVYASARTVEAIIYSEPYRNRIAMAKFKSYEHWTGLAAQQRAELAQVIGQAVADGMNPREARRLIQQRLDVSKAKALSYAQTDITDTLRQAKWAEDDAAEAELQVRTGELWTSALIPTTRAWHASRNGKVYTREQVRAFYQERGNRYNCFLPDQPVSGRFVAGIESRYEGPAVRLVTAAGRKLSVTANHPVLTARGMMPAAEVCEGDQLIAYRGEVEPALRVGDLDSGLMGARAEDVFGALVEAGHQVSARVSPVDLHGDARFCEPDVDVVRAERELVFALDTAAAQLLDDLALVLADTPAASGRALQSLIGGDPAASHGSVRGSGVVASLLRSEVRHPGEHRGASGSHIHASGDELSLQGATVYADGSTDRLKRLTALVAIDQVRQVAHFDYSGHVYDFQERSGLMLGSNIVASNCRCATTACLLDADGKPILTKKLQSSMASERKAWQSRYDKD